MEDKWYTITVTHTVSGQQFSMMARYPSDWAEEDIAHDVLKDISISAEEG